MRLIDADALMKYIDDCTCCEKCQVKSYRCDEDCDFPDYLTTQWKRAIDEQPTVDSVPVRHGKWIYGNDFHWYTASCNKCGYQRRTDIKADGWNQWKFCPNCGARMDAERKEE